MHTIVAFSESIDEAGAWANIAAVPDQHVRAEGDFIIVGAINQLIGEFACMGATADQCRLLAPSINRINPQYINNILNALVPDETRMQCFHPGAAVPLVTNEQLEAEANGNPAAGEQHTVIAALADGVLSPVTGDIRTVHFTVTPTLAAGVWAYSEIDLPDGLPVAMYDIVGARIESATSIAFRFVLNTAQNRPGGICVCSEEEVDVDYQRHGGLGIWGSFDSVALPGVEVIDSAATGATTLDGYMDIIQR